jgi:hypothetical protein
MVDSALERRLNASTCHECDGSELGEREPVLPARSATAEAGLERDRKKHRFDGHVSGRVRRLLIFGLLLTSMSMPSASLSQASYYCDEPDPPYCIDGYGTFDDEWSFSRCRNEVEAYVDDVVDFQQCLADWLDAAGREADEAVERFNCRAQGLSFCS